MKWIVDQTQKEGYVLVSWIHSHVGGTLCGFSSVDMHSQYQWEQSFPAVLGTVLQINEQNYCNAFDFYRLTEEGTNMVTFCNRTRSLHNTQHPQCYSLDFFASHIHQVSLVDASPLEITNISNIRPIDPFEDTNEDSLQCKGCLRVFPKASFAKHLGHHQRKKC